MLRRFGRGQPGAAAVPAAKKPLVGQRPVGTTGRMKRAKPPNVIGRGPLLEERGFGLAAVCIVKDEGAYLEEWLAYHLALGVDHVFLYDNGSTDGTDKLIEPYQNHGLVTRLDWPLKGGQLSAYNHALRFFGSACDWLAFFDPDEFIVPLVDDDIPSFLARFPTAADVRVPRVEFGFSGHRSPPQGLTIEAYTQVADVLARGPSVPARVKSIVRPHAVSAVDVHLAFPADITAPDTPADTAEAAVAGVAQLNHYYTRSWAEFEAKRLRGSSTGRIVRREVPFDLPTLDTDTSAQRFAERTRSMLERLRRLEPQPYVYGSQLRLEHFPRPNDLGRFAEFAIANTAAGLPEPARVAASRLKNLHAGVGLVADLAETAFEPTFGGLAASVHTDVLVAHMHGRMDIDIARREDRERIMVPRGTLVFAADGSARPGAPASLRPEGGVAELVVGLPSSDSLRCWHLGFLLGAGAPLRLTVSLERTDGTSSEPTEVHLPASRCAAGVLEVEPRPVDATLMRLRLEDAGEGITLHDLFLVSTG